MCISQKNQEIIRHSDFTTGFFAATQRSPENQQNFATSPASVLILLSVFLGSTGPQGKTANQICKAINGNDDECTIAMKERIRKHARNITEVLESAVTTTERTRIVQVSNAAFLQKDYSVKPAFQRGFSSDAKCTFQQIDFASNNAYSLINDWVKRSTENLIEKIYSSKDELSSDTRMVLLNAIYFKNAWGKTFPQHSIKTEVFRSTSKNKKINLVNMMDQIENLMYLKDEGSGYHLVIKDLESEQFKFIVMLPIVDLDMKSLDKALVSGVNWPEVQKNAQRKGIHLKLPKFKLETELELKSTLSSLGIVDLFDKFKANLSGITEEEKLFVNAAKQNVILEVDENGVKAAAVTSMQISPMSMLFPEVNFYVDQPFVCAIYDQKLQMPIFIARVTDPTY